MSNVSYVAMSLGSIGTDSKRKVLQLLAVLWVALSAPSVAQICNSAPVAINDEAFHEAELMIIDVLANDLEPDGEALDVTNVSTTCNATVGEDFGLVYLLPDLPSSEECTVGYDVADEQGNLASATVFVRSAGVIFKDGFESGDTSAWNG